MNNASLACQRTMNEGPIPVGEYYIDPAGLDDPNFVWDLARNVRVDHIADWGDFRVKLTPRPSTNTHTRNGFFLHGGSFPGSAGCIDVGGGLTGNDRTNLLKLAIKSSTTVIPVEVIA